MENNIYIMSEERKDSAKEFLRGLVLERGLDATITTLDDVMGVLIGYAVELSFSENRKNNDAIVMIHQLNNTINALKYIGTHDVLKKEG